MNIYAQEDFSAESAPPLEDPRLSYPYENKSRTRRYRTPSRRRTQAPQRQTWLQGLVTSSAKADVGLEGAGWPKEVRLLNRPDFDRVYTTGKRFGSPLFTAFFAPRAEVSGESKARIGFTTPRALGKAVVRNRVRRRLREVVRLQYPQFPKGWDVVFNPRRAIMETSFSQIESEVGRLLSTLEKKA
jgi:ribonuclease P protein component